MKSQAKQPWAKWRLHTAAAALLLGLTAQTAKSQPSNVSQPPIAIVHVNVVPMNRETVLHDQTVIVRNGKIETTGVAKTTVVPKDAHLIEGGGKYLIPGLTDSHVHLQTPVEFAVYLANGVTTVFNLDGRPAHLLWREKITKGEMVGPTIYSTGPIFFETVSAEDAVRRVDEQWAAGYDAVKIYNGVSKEAYGPLIAEAKKKNMLLMGHIARKPDFEATLDAGQSIAHLEEYTYTFFNPKRDDDDTHIVYDEGKIPEAVRLTAKAGIFVTATLANYATIVQQATDLDEFLKNPELRYDSPWIQAGFLPDADRYKNRFSTDDYPRLRTSLALQRKLVKALEDGGVPILSGTDASDVGPVAGFGLHHELQEFVNDGFTPYQALQTATVNPARYFRQSEQWGTIEPGKRADMVLLDANPLENISNTKKIAGIVLHGEWFDWGGLHSSMEKVPGEYEAQIQTMESLLETSPEKADRLMAEMDPFGGVSASALERMADGKDARTLVATLRQIHQKLPNARAVSEEAVNTLGYQLFRRQKTSEAIAVLRLNTEDFPKSANTWDSLGEILLKSGDPAGGVASYKKALEVDPNYPNAEAARKIVSEQGAQSKPPQS